MPERGLPAELLVTPEEGEFGQTGDAAEDLLAILAVHPMPEPAVERYLADAGAGAELLTELVLSGRAHRVEYLGHTYLVRRPVGEAPRL